MTAARRSRGSRPASGRVPAAARAATEAQFYYPPGAAAAEGWYDVEADRD